MKKNDYSMLINTFHSFCNLVKEFYAQSEKVIGFKSQEESTNFGLEFLFEVFVNKDINDDDYGVVLGLIIKSKLVKDQREIEFSAFKGNGRMIYCKDFYAEETREALERLDRELQSLTRECFAEVKRVLETEY